MEDVVGVGEGDRGRKAMEWKPGMELFCKNKPGWLRINGANEKGEMVGFYSEDGRGPSGL